MTLTCTHPSVGSLAKESERPVTADKVCLQVKNRDQKRKRSSIVAEWGYKARVTYWVAVTPATFTSYIRTVVRRSDSR